MVEASEVWGSFEPKESVSLLFESNARPKIASGTLGCRLLRRSRSELVLVPPAG